jgi:TP901 family phage tail tape measure protein
MGIAPARIAQAFTLLIKAGMSVEEAIAGAGKSAIEFAQVSGVEAAQAAEFMKVSMNVFGISAKDAADTLSAAADSSETSIASMIESFALVASVAKGTNQSLFGLSQGLAVLARYGIKGEEAGTGIKTLLVKLLSPTKDAREALAQLGLSMESLVDNGGRLLPLPQIAEKFSIAMKGMDKSARDAMLTNEALVNVFDVRGIRVIHAFGEQGKAGFDKIATAMESSRSVSQKFAIAMSGLTGIANSLVAVVDRLAIAFVDGGLATAVARTSDAMIAVIDKFSWLLTSVPMLSTILAGIATGFFTMGFACIGAGTVLQVVNFGIMGFIKIAATATAFAGGFTASLGLLSKALIAVRVAMLAIPGWGWLLTAMSASFAFLGWTLTSGGGKPPKAVGDAAASMPGAVGDAKSPMPEVSGGDAVGVVRDPVRNALRPGGSARPRDEASLFGRGESSGTFGSGSQIGIGTALTSAEETAENTGRTADGIDALVRNTQEVPPATALQAGIKNDSPAVAGRVAARSDRELLSASERTALASEKTAEVLLRMMMHRNGGLQFS